MTCNDCIKNDVCELYCHLHYEEDVEKRCKHIKNKADFVEVVRCRDCRYFTEGMAVGMCKRVEGSPILPCCYDNFCKYGERRNT